MKYEDDEKATRRNERFRLARAISCTISPEEECDVRLATACVMYSLMYEEDDDTSNNDDETIIIPNRRKRRRRRNAIYVEASAIVWVIFRFTIPITKIVNSVKELWPDVEVTTTEVEKEAKRFADVDAIVDVSLACVPRIASTLDLPDRATYVLTRRIIDFVKSIKRPPKNARDALLRIAVAFVNNVNNNNDVQNVAKAFSMKEDELVNYSIR